jgi:hypothetical protein
VKDRTGRTRRRDDRLDRARPALGNGSAAEGHRPSLERTSARFTSCLNRLVRTRMLGGVGAGEGDLPGYPIRWPISHKDSHSLVAYLGGDLLRVAGQHRIPES